MSALDAAVKAYASVLDEYGYSEESANEAAHELFDLRAQAKKLSALQAALSMSVQFLTNVNTITPEKTAEFIKALKDAGREDLADAVAVAGFASAFDMEEE